MNENFDQNQTYDVDITAPAVGTDPFSWGGLIAYIVVFLIILSIAFWLIKRLNRYSVRNMDSPWARVLDRQVLYGNQVLYLVEIAGKIQILGATDHHISKVEEINDPDIAAEILEEIAHKPEEKMDKFMSGIFNKLNPRKKKKDLFSSELERMLEEARK